MRILATRLAFFSWDIADVWNDERLALEETGGRVELDGTFEARRCGCRVAANRCCSAVVPALSLLLLLQHRADVGRVAGWIEAVEVEAAARPAVMYNPASLLCSATLSVVVGPAIAAILQLLSDRVCIANTESSSCQKTADWLPQTPTVPSAAFELIIKQCGLRSDRIKHTHTHTV